MGPVLAEPERYVLDGFALLAYFDGGPGAERVRELVELARGQQAALAVSVATVGEVIAVVERERGLPSAQTTLGRIWDLPIARQEVSEGLALAGARLASRWPLAYTDCLTLALTGQLGARLVTGNPAFRPLEGRVAEIEWLEEASRSPR